MANAYVQRTVQWGEIARWQPKLEAFDGLDETTAAATDTSGISSLALPPPLNQVAKTKGLGSTVT